MKMAGSNPGHFLFASGAERPRRHAGVANGLGVPMVGAAAASALSNLREADVRGAVAFLTRMEHWHETI